MERYSSYKDSGVEWLGEIPSHWELRKMKYTFNERSQKGFPNEPLLAATQNHGVIRKDDYENRTVEATKNLDTLKLVEEGDFVISLRSFQGGIEYSHCRGIISPAYTILTPTHITSDYFKFLGKSSLFIELLKSTVTGIREGQNIDYNKLKVEFLPIPPLSEQRAMSAYLDRATAQLDAAIAREQQMIDLLNERKRIIIQQAVTKGLDPSAKLKPSGVEWLGDVPEGWEVNKIKTVASLAGRIGFRGYSQSDLVDEGEGAITLSPSNMMDGGALDYTSCSYLSWRKYYESPEIMVEKGDILFVKTGSTYGKVSFVEELPMEATINPQIVLFKKINCNSKFLFYCLTTDVIQSQVAITVGGSTIPTLAQKSILNYLIPMPSLEEQNKIVEFLDHYSTVFDKTLRPHQQRISLLQERKQILISEVVTGKIKVS